MNINLPQHPDVAIWRPPTADDIDLLLQIQVAADAVDHPTWITPRSDFTDSFEASYIDHSRDSLIGLAADGTPIVHGSAFLNPSRESKLVSSVFGAVHPQWRRRGIGTALMPWAVARAREQIQGVGVDLPAEIKTYAEAVDVGKQRLSEHFGFTAERWFTTMERDLALPVEHREAPTGISVVNYDASRALDALEARNDSFRDHWGSLPTTEENWRQFVDGEFLRPDLTFLALDGDQVVAICMTSVIEDDWAALGASHSYIDLIGVVRSHRGQGLAPLVISRSLEASAAAGLERVVLDVDTASQTGANTLYERLGFAPTAQTIAYVQHV